MGQRSRKRSALAARPPVATAPPPAEPAPPAAAESPERGYARMRARDEALRAQLRPLEPGERPRPATVAAVVAALLGLGNLVAYLAGATIDGKRPGAVGILAFSALMLTAAGGMWRVRYWAVLGFEALLALITLTFTLFLLRASNVAGVLVCVVVIGFSAWLFWKLVRIMARVQIPSRRVP